MAQKVLLSQTRTARDQEEEARQYNEVQRLLGLGVTELLREALVLTLRAETAKPDVARALNARAQVIVQIVSTREQRDTRTAMGRAARDLAAALGTVAKANRREERL